MKASLDGTSFDTIIIGCGMAGLAAGIRLAMYDQRVLIVERHTTPGGLNSYYFLGGRKFDVGLHAVTNFVQPGRKGTPLAVLIRQLRLPREAFQLAPQIGSRISFPGVDLRFDNTVARLESEIERAFPSEIDGFRRLRREVLDHPGVGTESTGISARAVLARHFREPLLREMLLCPLMYYGASREDDMDFSLMVTLWKSIFEEGFGRPLEGIRLVIRVLVDRYRQAGGLRRMGCGVRRIITRNGRASGIELESGEVLQANHILSTAGRPETMLLCGSSYGDPDLTGKIGRLGFAETISVLDKTPAELGCRETIVFFNDNERFQYRQATEPVDLRSGVICIPNNYQYPDGETLPEGLLRVTNIASYHYWKSLAEAEYRAAKEQWFVRMIDGALRFLPEMKAGAVRSGTVFRDMFTPRTVEKYTGRLGGAIYGSPDKLLDGRTEFANLYLAGTDQGLLGIVGAMFSGVTMVNRHILTAAS